MTLIYTTTASSFGATSHSSGCIDTTNDYFLTVSSGNNFRRFNLATGAQVGTDIAVTANAQTVALVTPACAFVINSGTTHDFIELSSGYRQAVAGGANSTCKTFTSTTNANSAGYQLAANDGAGNILYIRGTNSSLGKLASSAQTFSNITVNQETSATFNCIIYKGGGRFLIGDDYGRIYEIDSAGVLYKTSIVPLGPTFTNRPALSSTTPSAPRILTLAFENDLLAIGTELGVFLMQYSTRQIIKYDPIIYSSSTCSTVLSQMSSGVVLSGSNGNNSSTLPTSLRELDCAVNPLVLRSRLFQSQAGTFTSQVQINPNTGHGCQVMSNLAATTNLISFFTLSPRAVTNTPISVTPSGVDVPFRLYVIDDTNGVGNRDIIFDTYIQSPATYKVPTGKTIMELIKYKDGSNAGYGWRRYFT